MIFESNKNRDTFKNDYITQVSQSEDVGAMAADEKPVDDQQENFSDISVVMGKSRREILAAQFECYLRIIHEPPHIEEGEQFLLLVQNKVSYRGL